MNCPTDWKSVPIDLFDKEESEQEDNWPDYRPDPYPTDGCCQACGRSKSELARFGTTESRSAFKTRALAMTVREVSLDTFAASWECPVCISREGTLWEIQLENKTGTQLPDKERNAIADAMEKELMGWLDTIPDFEVD